MKNEMIAQSLEDVDQVLDISGLTDENFDAYYTDVSEARGEDVTARISRKLKRSKSKNLKILLAGFKGTGKTTELKRLERELKGDYHIISISALEKLGGENATVAEFPIHMMRELINWIGSKRKFGKACEIEFNKFIKSLSGNVLDLKPKNEIEIEFHLNQLVSDSLINNKFRKFAQDNTYTLIHSTLLCFDLLLEEFYESNEAKKVLFIVDDMEKIDTKVAEDILVKHIRKFASRNCSYIFIFPMSLQVRFDTNTLMHEFDDNYSLTMVKVHEKNGYDYNPGITYLTSTIHKRISDKLISDTLLKQFIRMSGGSLRDLFLMLKIAADNALGRDATIIQDSDFNYALEKIKSQYAVSIVHNEQRGITANDYYRILMDCYKSKDKKPLSEKGLMDLKLNNTLLGYETDTWFDVHPIVQEIIIDKVRIKTRRLGTSTEQKSMGLPPITLKRLHLNNIRCFKDAEFTISSKGSTRPWTLLVGNNGVGKSTILQCIALCSLGPDLVSQLVPIPRDMLRVGADEGFMEAEFEVPMESTEKENPRPEVTIRLNIAKDSRTFEIQYPKNKKAREQVKEFLNNRKRTDFEGWFVAAYGPVRNLLYTDDPSKLSNNDPIIDRLESLFDPTKPLIDPTSLKRFLSGDTSVFRKLGAPEILSNSTFNSIRELLVKLLPKISFLKNGDKENLKTPFGLVPISGLSEGYKSMLSWLAHLLMHMLAAVKWDGELSDINGIVLIDEVDLHLHPQWQRKVIPTLRKSFHNMQFICCTHAPMTAGGAEDNEIILLEQEGDGIRVRKDLPSIKGWRADQILTSLLFGLEATRDAETEEKLKKYSNLLGKKDPTEEDKTQLKEWEEELGDLIPATMETPLEREVYELIMSTLKERIAKQKKEQKEKLDIEKVDNEVKRQIKRALK